MPTCNNAHCKCNENHSPVYALYLNEEEFKRLKLAVEHMDFFMSSVEELDEHYYKTNMPGDIDNSLEVIQKAVGRIKKEV